MSDRDPAFLWETEALRMTARAPVRSRERPSTPPSPTSAELSDAHSDTETDVWLTLREAHTLTGIPVETLRKWARRESIPSYLDETEFGVRRMVSLTGVRARARNLGRPLSPIVDDTADDLVGAGGGEHAQEQTAASPPPSRLDFAAPGDPVAPIDIGALEATGRHDVETGVSPSSPPAPPTKAPPEPEPPPGTMLVPIDAWEKMLLQLGNLHEAGQQLAEARERAAKAETESAFLKERLAELRSERDEAITARDDAIARSQEQRSPIHDALATAGPAEQTKAAEASGGEPRAAQTAGRLAGDPIEVTGPEAAQPGYTETLMRYVLRGRRGRFFR